MSLRSTILTSLVVAAASSVIPYKFHPHAALVVVEYSLSVIWLALVVYAVVKYRFRGLWVLIGLLPLVAWMLHLALIGANWEIRLMRLHS